MATLRRLYAILTTDPVRTDAKSDSRMRLVFDNGTIKREFELGGQPHDEREPGRTDLYRLEFSQQSNVEMDDIVPTDFKIVAAGEDAWLPSSIFILGEGSGQFKVLVANEEWPDEGWFSTQTSDANGRAEKARLLDRDGTPTTA